MFLGQDTCNTISISDNLVHISINEDLHGEKAKASLLGTGGEELQRFLFSEGLNTIDLNFCEPPAYSLRLETANEVVVKQLPKSTIKQL